MATLSTAGWVVHDLGLAATLGGNLFGQAALYPAVKELPEQERVDLLDRAWRRQSVINLAGHLAFALPWFIGRSMRSGRSLGRGGRALVMIKDALVGTALASGIASILLGRKLGQEHRRTHPEGREQVHRLEKIERVLGTVNLVSAAGVAGVTAALASVASESFLWSASHRMLP